MNNRSEPRFYVVISMYVTTMMVMFAMTIIVVSHLKTVWVALNDIQKIQAIEQQAWNGLMEFNSDLYRYPAGSPELMTKTLEYRDAWQSADRQSVMLNNRIATLTRRVGCDVTSVSCVATNAAQWLIFLVFIITTATMATIFMMKSFNSMQSSYKIS